MSINFIVSDSGTMNIVLPEQSKSYSVSLDHPAYHDIREAIKKGDVATILNLAEIPSMVDNFSRGQIKIVEGQLFYGDYRVNNNAGERIINLVRRNLPVEALLNWLDRLMGNSSKRAIDELYNFMVRKAHVNGADYCPLPITEDGYFLAYKSVQENYTDWWTGKIDNSIGQHPSMPRNLVDDNWGENCSEGFHCGSLAYVGGYHGHEGHQVVVKVDPKDVVCVPSDLNATKCRVCEYTVLCDYTGELKGGVYKAPQVGHSPEPIATNQPMGRQDDDVFSEDVGDDEDEAITGCDEG